MIVENFPPPPAIPKGFPICKLLLFRVEATQMTFDLSKPDLSFLTNRGFFAQSAFRFLAVNVQSELDSEIVFLIAFAQVAKLFFSCLSGYCILLPSVQKFSKQLF